jgi:hypothetical protein
VLASATIPTKLFSNFLKNKQRQEIKMEDVDRLQCQADYFEIQVQETLIQPL